MDIPSVSLTSSVRYICVPYVVTLLSQTPMFGFCSDEETPRNDAWYNEIEVCA